MSAMTTVIRQFKTTGKNVRYLILECGHWYKWTSDMPVKQDAEFLCPNCTSITVKSE